MNPREGDLLEVVYWEALVISWHLRLSSLDTEPDPKGLTYQQSLDHQNQSVWGSKRAPFGRCPSGGTEIYLALATRGRIYSWDS
jgi:hypothetical protein